TAFEIPTALRPWRSGAERRYAGISSFGWAGTNAHAILEEAPAPLNVPVHAPADGRDQLLPLSARSKAALRDLARAYIERLRASSAPETQAPSPLADLCYSASVRRSHHDHRLALVGQTHEQLADRLEAWLQQGAAPGLSCGVAPSVVVFV